MRPNLDWLRGCATALVTPFDRNGELDERAFSKLVKRQVENGVKLLVPCGTTGESSTTSAEEDRRIIEITVEIARELGARVIAGTGSNNTKQAIGNTYVAREAGADAALIVAPYYNKPTQEGVFAHYAAIAAAAGEFPILLYNVPGRTAVNIDPDTVFRLTDRFENIVGIKEASADLAQATNLIANRPMGFKVFAGDDASALSLLSCGADGLISVCSNQFPLEVSSFIEEAMSGDIALARLMYFKLLPLMEANFIETSPAPCKFVMSEMGLLEEQLRLPLVPVTERTRERLRQILGQILSIEVSSAKAM